METAAIHSRARLLACLHQESHHKFPRCQLGQRAAAIYDERLSVLTMGSRYPIKNGDDLLGSSDIAARLMRARIDNMVVQED